ncbi:HNH endonuclease [Mesorhizobium sp. BR-1-1-8]|uniref:HNH endonuclease n=1 Tax=Mesorhizobium sp. BR-1-1-8 TaxID=2876659 RepID=UPI0029621C42|nr:HNH endonuclease [Mesorhizobium sp. BR-1-1-8]
MNNGLHRHLRWLMFGQQDGRCFYCDELMLLSFAQRDNIWSRTATLEHLVRRADGGSSTRGNLVCACRECNQKRGDIPWEEYRALRRDRRMT